MRCSREVSWAPWDRGWAWVPGRGLAFLPLWACAPPPPHKRRGYQRYGAMPCNLSSLTRRAGPGAEAWLQKRPGPGWPGSPAHTGCAHILQPAARGSVAPWPRPWARTWRSPVSCRMTPALGVRLRAAGPGLYRQADRYGFIGAAQQSQGKWRRDERGTGCWA